MAQTQKAPRQAKDPYAQRSKELTSAVQRLRGWVGSDPSRLGELGDALVALTGHRLRGHEFAAAGADAQDSVKQAAQLLTAPRSGRRLHPARRRRPLRHRRRAAGVGPGRARAWPRPPAARSPRSTSSPSSSSPCDWSCRWSPRRWSAPSSAPPAERWRRGTWPGPTRPPTRRCAGWWPPARPTTPTPATSRSTSTSLVADARWAADRPAEALAGLRQAQHRWRDSVDGRLDNPAGLSPSLVARLTAPAAALHRALADRLVATGELDLGLETRRALVDLLRRVAGRPGAPAPRLLAEALADLAADLLAAGRVEEADEASAEALAVLGVAGRAGVADGGARAGPHRHRARGRGGAAAPVAPRRRPREPAEPLAALVRLELAAADLATGAGDAARSTPVARSRPWSRTRCAASSAAVPGRSPGRPDRRSGTDWCRRRRRRGRARHRRRRRSRPPGWLEAERAEAHRREEERAARARAEAAQRAEEERERARRAAEEEEQARLRAAEERRAEEARRAAAEEAARQEVEAPPGGAAGGLPPGGRATRRRGGSRGGHRASEEARARGDRRGRGARGGAPPTRAGTSSRSPSRHLSRSPSRQPEPEPGPAAEPEPVPAAEPEPGP